MITKDHTSSAASGLADPALLDKIDKLFACNVGHYVDLPQLVVVGDQSSGKSSVLEGLTGLPFPRDSGLCTRFATQIIFKRSPTSSISVSIIPSKAASEQHKTKASLWKKDDIKHLDAITFKSIMQEVQSVMGVGEKSQVQSVMGVGETVTFSDDVFKLEVSGPEAEHLSIVDVPGIFRTATDGLTTNEDKKLVRSMVLSYMENPRSLMLAVIPANVDAATQEILSMAKEVDSEGQRTMGILTKPDLVDKGAEPPVVELMNGRKHRLALGWYMVRNLGQSQLDDPTADRYSLEENFFKSVAPWNTLEKETVGIPSLKIRITEVLNEHVKAEFPKVRSELSKLLTQKQNLLKALGPSRDSRTEQAQYLTAMASDFSDMLNKALSTSYTSKIFDDHDELRLPTLAVARFDTFRETMLDFGHTYEFDGVPINTTYEIDGDGFLKAASTCATREVHTVNDLAELVYDDSTVAKPTEEKMIPWLNDLHRDSRGFELGTFQATLLATVMRAQSDKWASISLGFISDMACYTHEFITTLLEIMCPDKRVREVLLFNLMPGLHDRYKKAIEHVEFLLSVEREDIPITADQTFLELLQKKRRERQDEVMSNAAFGPDVNLTMKKVTQALQNLTMSSTDQMVTEIHDITKSYYDIAVRRFVDNVCQQAASRFLINGPDTPLRLFSPKFVSGLSDEQLAEIAAEEPGIRRKRSMLMREIVDLLAGRKILFSV